MVRDRAFIFHMSFLVVRLSVQPRSRSSFKVRYQGHSFQKIGALPSKTSCISLPHNTDFLTTWGKKAFENILGKGENAGNPYFPLCPKCFLLYQTAKIFSSIFSIVCECLRLGT